MSTPECYTKVLEYLKSLPDEFQKAVPKRELRKFADRLAEKQAQGLPAHEFNAMAKKFYVDYVERIAAAQRADAINNMRVRVNALKTITQDIPGMSAGDKVDAWILGNSRRMGDSTNLSLSDLKDKHVTKFQGMLRSLLTEGDFKLSESGLLEKEITQELGNLQNQGAQSISGSEQAYKIAKAYHGVLKSIAVAKKAYSPFFREADNYFYRATHDPVKISENREGWKAFMLSSGTAEKSFPELTVKELGEKLDEISNEIITGRHGSSVVGGEPGNIAARIAKHRTFLWDNADTFYEYNKLFGNSNVHATMERAITDAAHDIATIQKFGTNPRENFDRVVSGVKNGMSRDEAIEFRSREKKLLRKFEQVTQRSSTPLTHPLAKLSRGAQSVVTLSINNAAWLRSFADIANVATVISDTFGQSYFKSIGEAVTTYVKFFSTTEASRKEAASLMHIFGKSSLHNFFEESGGVVSKDTSLGDKVLNGFSRLLELQSHVTGMRRHHSTTQAAMGNIFSKKLGLLTERAYAQLPENTKASLLRYGVREAEWNAISHAHENWTDAPGITPAYGRVDRMLTTDAIERLSDDIVEKYLREAGEYTSAKPVPKSLISKGRLELSSRIGAMANQLTNSASSTASHAEFINMFRGTDPNDPDGMMLRLFFQFKSASVKNYDTMMRSAYSNPSKPQGDFSKPARHVVTAAFFYTVGKIAQDLFEGKTPEDPATAEFAAKALIYSGGAGLYLEPILGEMIRGKNAGSVASGVASLFAGATGELAANVIGVGTQATRSIFDETVQFPSAAFARTVTRTIPFANLPWTKPVMNYYILNAFNEALSPGSLGRKQERMATTPALGGGTQEYFLPFSGE